MRRVLYIFLIVILTSCGTGKKNKSPSLTSNGGTGVFLDSDTSFDLFKVFEEVKQCSGLKKGSFLELSIMFRQRSEICTGGCDGKFSSPNTIMVSPFDPKVWRHEFLHYLFFSNLDDANSNHMGTLFETCSELLLDSGLPSTGSNAGKGVFLDQNIKVQLFNAFNEVQQCSGFLKGSFLELSIMFRQNSKICNGGCAGTFVAPNTVIVSSFDLELWRHEFLHYLFFANLGDPDSLHLDSRFTTCTKILGGTA